MAAVVLQVQVLLHLFSIRPAFSISYKHICIKRGVLDARIGGKRSGEEHCLEISGEIKCSAMSLSFGSDTASVPTANASAQ